MNFIIVVKDEKNELSFTCDEVKEVLEFVEKIMKKSNYTIEIITNMEV